MLLTVLVHRVHVLYHFHSYRWWKACIACDGFQLKNGLFPYIIPSFSSIAPSHLWIVVFFSDLGAKTGVIVLARC